MNRRLIPIALSASLALAGCAGGAVRGAGTSSGTAVAGAKTFVYSYHLNVVTDWDPATSYSNELIAMENIYESLTKYDPATKKVVPRLATSWEHSGDGKTWTFHLQPGVKFHTGRPLDAAAAKAAIQRTIALKGGPAYIWDSVGSIDAADPTTLVFHLKYAAPLDLVASSDYAAYIYDTKAAGSADLKKWLSAGHDAGSGPYTVASWTKGQEVELRLAAFKDYWGGWKPDSYQAVEFRVTSEVTTASQLLQRQQVTFVDRMNPQLFEQASHQAGLSTSHSASFQNLLALFNTAKGPMADVRVRQAVQSAIDVNGLVGALKGAGVAASGVIPEGLLGYDGSLTLHQDLARARQLLAQAGYGSGGKPLTLSLTYAQGDDDQQLFVTLLTSALSQLGVHLEAKPQQWSAQWDQAKSADPGKHQDIFVMYWYPDYADPFSWFTNLFHSANPPYFNMTYLSDKSVDAAIDGMPALTATDPAQAGTKYQQLQTDLVQTRATIAPLIVESYQRAYLSSVKGYVDNPAYPDVVFVHDLSAAS
jgi:peptide/nickel transport system substrate-binding protein